MELLKDWIAQYDPKDALEFYNAKREIVQEIALAGLSRNGFFEDAVFYGGTALRILYGIDRFSEDLDFSLIQKNIQFTIEPYLEAIEKEFELLGLEVEVTVKKKKSFTKVESAFLKDNSEWSFIKIKNSFTDRLLPEVKIKIEVDRDPPLGFKIEPKLLIRPYSFYINVMSREDLFAGKMHAVLFRSWKNNVKGRDWYDLQWYISKGITLNLDHFRIRSVESGHWPAQSPLCKSDLKDLYGQKVEQLDIEMAKADISRFIADPSKVRIWSGEYFLQLFDHIKLNNDIAEV